MINYAFPLKSCFVCDFKNKFESYYIGTITMKTWSIVVENSLSSEAQRATNIMYGTRATPNWRKYSHSMRLEEDVPN